MGILNVDNLRGVGSGTSVTCLSNRLETTNINASGIVTATSFTGTLNTAAQGNITSLGTLNGLVVDKNEEISMSSGAAGQLVVGGNGYTSAIALDTDAMHIYHNSSSRDMVFGINETERVRINSSGAVGIGTSVPDGNLHVHNSNAGSVSAAGDANEFVIESAANVGMSFLTGATSLSRIKFGDTTANNRGIFYFNHSDQSFNFQQTSSNKLKIKSDGDVSIIDGNLVVADGHGIDFSATPNPTNGASTSELLDYYEEGTFTPAFGGLSSVSYSTQFGKYTRIGRQVFCTAVIDATGIDESSNITLTGLPYSSTDSSDNQQRSTWLLAYGGHITGVSDATARFRSAGSSWQGVKGTASTSYLTGAQLSSSGTINITGSFSYYVA